MKRYNLVRLGNGFFVTDSQSAILKALTHEAQAADVNRPDEVKYFNLTLEAAKELADHLNR